jgi:uncharacterized protein (TIGR04255 family)
VRGFVFQDEPRKRVVQVRRDGFTFSRLAPYETWETLRDDANVAWKRYVEIVAPTAATRVAVRYINRLNLPAGELQLSDWFALRPEAPEQLGPLTDLLIRVVFTHPDNPSYTAVVTLGTAPPDGSSAGAAFLFDIDTWVERKHDIDGEIWNTLEDLRVYKNDVFYGSLTSAVIERLKK